MKINSEEKSFLLDIARQSLEKFIEEKIPYIPPLDLLNQFSKESSIIFKNVSVYITLRDKKTNKIITSKGSLNKKEALYLSVMSHVVNLINEKEFLTYENSFSKENLIIDISIMDEAIGPLKKDSIESEIEIGNHGLIIDNSFQKGLLLPKVAVEYKYSIEEFLEQTCVQAGLHKSAYKNENTDVYKFASINFSEKK